MMDCGHGGTLTKAKLRELVDILLESAETLPLCTLLCGGCGKPMLDPGVPVPFDCPHCEMTITERRLVE